MGSNKYRAFKRPYEKIRLVLPTIWWFLKFICNEQMSNTNWFYWSVMFSIWPPFTFIILLGRSSILSQALIKLGWLFRRISTLIPCHPSHGAFGCRISLWFDKNPTEKNHERSDREGMVAEQLVHHSQSSFRDAGCSNMLKHGLNNTKGHRHAENYRLLTAPWSQQTCSELASFGSSHLNILIFQKVCTCETFFWNCNHVITPVLFIITGLFSSGLSAPQILTICLLTTPLIRNLQASEKQVLKSILSSRPTV